SFPRQIFFNWQDKLQYLLDHPDEVFKIRTISGVPTWIFSLFKAFEEKFQKPCHELFPHLKLVVHGGVDFTHYFDKFREAFPDRALTFFENYNATEGLYGFQYVPEKREMLLCTNTGIFFEFKDHTGAIYPLWETQTGKTYEVLISNQDGLLRYQTGDLITIHGLQPVLFTIAGRTSEFINAFGEDLMVSQTDTAIQRLNQAFSLAISDYVVFPEYASTSEMGFHQWVVFSDKVTQQQEWANFLDDQLCELNNNYRQKRDRSRALQALRLEVLPRSELDRLMKRLGKEIGGQAKLKKLHNDPAIKAHLPQSSYRHF
ncbi:MAG: GH3 auxin-responsive promoter family protein, partial [Bacteroidota bacterium]